MAGTRGSVLLASTPIVHPQLFFESPFSLVLNWLANTKFRFAAGMRTHVAIVNGGQSNGSLLAKVQRLSGPGGTFAQRHAGRRLQPLAVSVSNQGNAVVK